MGGGWGGGGGGWEAEGGLNLPLGHWQWCCVFSKGQKEAQSTGQTKVVIGSSLAPVTCLLMPSRGFTGPVVHPRGFTGSAKSLL